MTTRRQIVHVYDGEWITIAWTGQHEACCGCGTEHVVDYRVVDGKLQFKATNKGKRRDTRCASPRR